MDAGISRERKRAAAYAEYKRFRRKAKTLAQGQFICPEHFNRPWGGAPQSGAGPKKDAPRSGASFLEATPGFEPGNQGFADPCLTTWLCRHIENRSNCACSCSPL